MSVISSTECRRRLSVIEHCPILGAGKNGQVYPFCSKTGNGSAKCNTCDATDFVVKLCLSGYEDFEKEAQAMITLSGTKCCPEIYDHWWCDGTGYIIMERIRGDTMTVFLSKYEPSKKFHHEVYGVIIPKLFTKLSIARQHNLVHREPAGDNLMVTYENGIAKDVILIDWGMMSYEDEYPFEYTMNFVWNAIFREISKKTFT